MQVNQNDVAFGIVLETHAQTLGRADSVNSKGGVYLEQRGTNLLDDLAVLRNDEQCHYSVTTFFC